MFSKWRHRDLHSLRKVTQLATGPRLQIQESGANVWAPDSSLHHDKTSPGAHPRAEPQAGSTAACSLLVSLHGWPAPQPPCIVSERLLECGASVHLLRPVLLTAFLCPFEFRKKSRISRLFQGEEEWKKQQLSPWSRA